MRTESMATLPPPTMATRLPVEHRGVGARELVGGHQVDAGEVFVGGVDALEVLAGDVHEHRQAGAVGDEDGVELLAQFRQRCRCGR